MLNTVVRQIAFCEFEKRVHGQRQKGELSTNQLNKIWMDVQGGEGKVLGGASETLKRTKAIFLEVALVRSPYKGASLFHEINRLLEAHGFLCAGLGLDAWNGTGNALFVKNLAALICR